MNTEEYVLV